MLKIWMNKKLLTILRTSKQHFLLGPLVLGRLNFEKLTCKWLQWTESNTNNSHGSLGQVSQKKKLKKNSFESKQNNPF